MILIDSSSTVVSRSPDNFPSISRRTILRLGLVGDTDIMSYISPRLFLTYSFQWRIPLVILRYIAHLDSSNKLFFVLKKSIAKTALASQNHHFKSCNFSKSHAFWYFKSHILRLSQTHSLPKRPNVLHVFILSRVLDAKEIV